VIKYIDRPKKQVRDAEQHVTETMLNIVAEREKTYIQNAAKLYGEIKRDKPTTKIHLVNWIYDSSVGRMVQKE
jgi:hypothetical protein